MGQQRQSECLSTISRSVLILELIVRPLTPLRPQLGKALKDLEHREFLAIEKAMFAGLIGCVRTIEVFSKAIEAILDDATSVLSYLLHS